MTVSISRLPIVVTGGAGFIGANLVAGLNALGRDDVIVVDDLTDGKKFRNLADLSIADYLDKDEFIERLEHDASFKAEAILHQGACSATTEWDGRFMMDVNYRYSKRVLRWCDENAVPLIYASSASVYGAGPAFVERDDAVSPLNVYGWSKALFDRYVLARSDVLRTQVVGLRYFNVYGPRETHKGSMASVALHFDRQVREEGVARLFTGSDGYADGEQRRDFIYVSDVCDVVLWCLANPNVRGVFNLGTGRSQTFNDIARAVIDWHGRGQIEYVPFPEHLVGRYQSFTQADLSALRAAGCDHRFMPVEDGVRRYLDALHAPRDGSLESG
ncbi:MAG: ADP-glyceromanno-heptose 6-epimerase [Pseudomonadota bacterium]